MDRNIFLKACSYCAYQERTQDEVRERLKKWKVWGEEAEEIISELIQENFLNEERFAKVFAGSKFRVKKWGRRKIEMELKRRRLSPYCIRQGMAEIEDDSYRQALTELLEKKARLLNEKDIFLKRQKLYRYAAGKGYEGGLIGEVLKEIFQWLIINGSISKESTTNGFSKNLRTHFEILT